MCLESRVVSMKTPASAQSSSRGGYKTALIAESWVVVFFLPQRSISFNIQKTVTNKSFLALL